MSFVDVYGVYVRYESAPTGSSTNSMPAASRSGSLRFVIDPSHIEPIPVEAIAAATAAGPFTN